MPFAIETDDGIIIEDIPDNIAPDSEEIRAKVTELRQERMSAQVAEQEEAQPQFTQEPPGFLRTLQGEAELAGTVATGAVLEPIAGVAGIVQSLNPFAEPGAGERAVETVRSLSFKPGREGIQVAKSIGEIVKDVTPDVVEEFVGFLGDRFNEFKEAAFQKYGPVAGTAVAIAPTAILEAVPGFFALKKARDMRTTRADEAIEEAADLSREAGETSIKTDIPPEAKDFEQIANDLKQQDTTNLVGEIRPDEEILKSAQNLGVDLNPSHYSTNQAFIEMEQALKANPSSQLSVIEQRAILRVGEEADRLILDLGGTTDRSLLDANVKSDIERTIGRLENEGAIAYNAVNQKIPKNVKVRATAANSYIVKRLDDLGGDKALLNKSEKELLRLSLMKENPSYGALDQVRRNVGEAQAKQAGPFRDDEESILRQVYGVLSEDQQGVADAFGVGADYELGRKLVSTRKGLEKQALTLFGREMQGSLVPKLLTAATQLTKGDVSGFKKIMDALPKNQRSQAAATMLNEFFSSGARKKGAIGGGFVSAFEALKRNPGAKKMIFDELPPGAEKRFNDLGRVATGIFKAKAFENVSGTGRALIAAFNEGTILDKVLGTVLESGVIRGSAAFVPGGRTGLDIGSNLVRNAKSEGTKKLDQFITSPAFKKSLEDAALGNAVQAENIQRTKVFKDWLTQTTPDVKTEIAAIGFIPWLMNEEIER